MAGRSKFEVVGKKSVLLHKSQEKLKFKLWRLPISTPVELEKSDAPLLEALSSGTRGQKWNWGYLSLKRSHVLLKNTILPHSSLVAGVSFFQRLYHSLGACQKSLWILSTCRKYFSQCALSLLWAGVLTNCTREKNCSSHLILTSTLVSYIMHACVNLFWAIMNFDPSGQFFDPYMFERSRHSIKVLLVSNLTAVSSLEFKNLSKRHKYIWLN